MEDKEEQESWIEHFSHPSHKLKEVHKRCKFQCQVCKWEGQGSRYQCEPCNFDIHTICATLLESLSSFAHPEHELSLKPKPSLIHKCRLCGETVKGMVYRCEAVGCKFFLHPLCSQLLELLKDHPKHPQHTLRLIGCLDSKKSCDVCNMTCKSWRYSCEACDVHIHVGCLFGGRPGGSGGGGGSTSDMVLDVLGSIGDYFLDVLAEAIVDAIIT